MGYEDSTLRIAFDFQDNIIGLVSGRYDSLRNAIIAPLYANSDDVAKLLLLDILKTKCQPATTVWFGYVSSNGFMKSITAGLGNNAEVGVLTPVFSREIVKVHEQVYCIAGDDIVHI